MLVVTPSLSLCQIVKVNRNMNLGTSFILGIFLTRTVSFRIFESAYLFFTEEVLILIGFYLINSFLNNMISIAHLVLLSSIFIRILIFSFFFIISLKFFGGLVTSDVNSTMQRRSHVRQLKFRISLVHYVSS